MDASLIRDPLGNLEIPSPGNFNRWLEGSGKGASFFAGALLGGIFSEDPEGYGEEDSGDGHVRSTGTLRDS